MANNGICGNFEFGDLSQLELCAPLLLSCKIQSGVAPAHFVNLLKTRPFCFFKNARLSSPICYSLLDPPLSLPEFKYGVFINMNSSIATKA